jgi:DNA-binding response OmpR family regulator
VLKIPAYAERMILLLEDDEKLGKQIAAQLKEAGFDVEWHLSAEPPFHPNWDRYELVLLDLMMPGVYGLDILKTLRETSEIPVIILSARNDSADVVRGLKLGADDYLRKPFWPNELLARVQTRLRRRSTMGVRGLKIDTDARTVHVDDTAVDLTRVEFDLLAALAKRPGVAVSRDWLTEHVLDRDDAEQRTLDVHFSRLRKKIGSERIATVRGIGYRLETER